MKVKLVNFILAVMLVFSFIAISCPDSYARNNCWREKRQVQRAKKSVKNKKRRYKKKLQLFNKFDRQSEKKWNRIENKIENFTIRRENQLFSFYMQTQDWAMQFSILQENMVIAGVAFGGGLLSDLFGNILPDDLGGGIFDDLLGDVGDMLNAIVNAATLHVCGRPMTGNELINFQDNGQGPVCVGGAILAIITEMHEVQLELELIDEVSAHQWGVPEDFDYVDPDTWRATVFQMGGTEWNKLRVQNATLYRRFDVSESRRNNYETAMNTAEDLYVAAEDLLEDKIDNLYECRYDD